MDGIFVFLKSVTITSHVFIRLLDILHLRVI